MTEKTEVVTEVTETAEVVEPTEGEISLSDMFNDSEAVETTKEVVAETKDEKGVTEEVTATDETEAKPTTEAEPPPAETIGLQAALVAERQKRQAAEEKLKGLEEPETVPDPIEDPEGYASFIESKSDKGLLDAKIEISRDLYIDSKPDYLEKEQIFMKDILGAVGDDDGKLVSVTNQILLDQFRKSNNPAKFVYDQAITYLDVKAKSAPDYEEKLKAQLKAEILAELKSPEAETKTVTATEMPNLTSAAGSNAIQPEPEVSLSNMFDDEAA